jgi:DNA-binding PadR family transcriptional regulator
MSRVFAHGGLRLYLLLLLEDESRHGYDLIRLLEDRFMGMYTPSAGTIYPRLAALEADGLIEHEVVDGKKVYALTRAGRTELDDRRDEIAGIASEAVHSARELAREIRDEVRSSVRDLRRELKDSVRDVRREERRSGRDFDAGSEAAQAVRKASRDVSREVARQTREVLRAERVARTEAGQELRDVLRSLRSDLESFVTDVVSAARRHHLDAERLRLVSDALLEARELVIDVLDGRPLRPRDSGETDEPMGAKKPAD